MSCASGMLVRAFQLANACQTSATPTIDATHGSDRCSSAVLFRMLVTSASNLAATARAVAEYDGEASVVVVESEAVVSAGVDGLDRGANVQMAISERLTETCVWSSSHSSSKHEAAASSNWRVRALATSALARRTKALSVRSRALMSVGLRPAFSNERSMLPSSSAKWMSTDCSTCVASESGSSEVASMPVLIEMSARCV